MDKELNLVELKEIRLNMLKEIHDFCEKNGIKYSLSCGTLLGAIRHNGYIPWDDDVDIMMPLPDMLRFRKLFVSNTMKYCDVDVDKTYENSFSEIVNLQTFRKTGFFSVGRGVGIDVYPIISLSEEENERGLFFKEGLELYDKTLLAKKWKRRVQHYLSIDTYPGMHTVFKQYRDYLLFNCPSYGTTKIFYVNSGPLSNHHIRTFNFDLFSRIIKVSFEGLQLNSISSYDLYLSQLYGDYMELPPADERLPYHGQVYYKK